MKVTLDAAQTSRARKLWDSKRTAGGGLFLFSVSETRAESSDDESVREYAMAGQMILRAPAPQIAAYFVQLTPPDESSPLTQDDVREIGKAMGFLKDLADAHRSEPLPSGGLVPPQQRP